MSWNPFRARHDRNFRRIAAVLLALPEDQHFGLDLARNAGVAYGSMYPILTEMLVRSWVSDGWEDPEPEGRRPRRWYMVTAKGERELSAILRGEKVPS